MGQTETRNCPRCGIALNETICPHCGPLDDTPSANPGSGPTHRRLLKVAGAVVLLLVCVAGMALSAFLTLDQWVASMPSSVLFLLSRDKDDEAAKELLRRLEDGDLNGSQINRMLADHLGGPKLAVRSPYPSGVEQLLRLNCPSKLPFHRWQIGIRNMNLSVDGAPQEAAYIADRQAHRLDDLRALIVLPPLDAGVHKIEIQGDLCVEDIRAATADRVRHQRPVRLVAELIIKDEVTDYLGGSSEDELPSSLVGASWAASVSAVKRAEGIEHILFLEEASMPERIIASVWVRAQGTNESFATGHLKSQCWGHRRCTRSHAFVLKDIPGLDEASAIQVKIVPDIAEAIAVGAKAIFCSPIEWEALHLPIAREGLMNLDGSAPSPPDLIDGEPVNRRRKGTSVTAPGA